MHVCGIAGGCGRPSRRLVEEMLEAIRHRGPDESGIYTSGGAVVLSQTRLTIIDLETGRQPLSNEDGDVWVTYNGEIYNYRVLRDWLSRRGHRFRTATDTEVLVHLYEELGPAMVERLQGMFAFALWDGRNLLLARDPLGIKPLYLGWAQSTLYFASELRALLGRCEDVEEFPNGHYAVYGPAGPVSRPVRFWGDTLGGPPVSDPAEAVATLRQKLRAAVTKRLVADVPLGVFLSGGLDSSFVSALAREAVEGELHSFAVGMRGSQDLAFSRLVARHLGTVHHTYEYTADEVIAALPEVIRHLESFDPALVRSAVPTFFVSRLARQYVKVVLSGEGADELFAGYEYLRDVEPAGLQSELEALVRALHNTNLQRVDRMTMAHSLEGRVPFLDVDVVDYAFRLPPEFKLRREAVAGAGGAGAGWVEKWILRKAAEPFLPAEVVWRAKEKFAHGTGTSEVLARWAGPGGEEAAYRRIFARCFPEVEAGRLVGRTRSVVPGEIA